MFASNCWFIYTLPVLQLHEFELDAVKSLQLLTHFWVYGCICTWIKPWKRLQAMTQNLDPVVRLPVTDHIGLAFGMPSQM